MREATSGRTDEIRGKLYTPLYVNKLCQHFTSKIARQRTEFYGIFPKFQQNKYKKYTSDLLIVLPEDVGDNGQASRACVLYSGRPE